MLRAVPHVAVVPLLLVWLSSAVACSEGDGDGKGGASGSGGGTSQTGGSTAIAGSTPQSREAAPHKRDKAMLAVPSSVAHRAKAVALALVALPRSVARRAVAVEARLRDLGGRESTQLEPTPSDSVSFPPQSKRLGCKYPVQWEARSTSWTALPADSRAHARLRGPSRNQARVHAQSRLNYVSALGRVCGPDRMGRPRSIRCEAHIPSHRYVAPRWTNRRRRA
jgi:hypothetical protein